MRSGQKSGTLRVLRKRKRKKGGYKTLERLDFFCIGAINRETSRDSK